MRPVNSPWGKVDYQEMMKEGVYSVSTPGHGGIMVHKSIELSDAAKNQAEVHGEFYCFEEDCLAVIAIHELGLKARVSPEEIKRSLCFWCKDYVIESGNQDWLKEYPTRD